MSPALSQLNWAVLPQNQLSDQFMQPHRIIVPLLWALLLVFGLPAVQRIPLPLRMMITMISIGAIYWLATSIRGWKQVLLAPLYLILVVLQFLVWSFPGS